MFSTATLDFVGRLHRSGLRCCIITAGAGSTAVSALMSVPGCSRTLLDAIVPYSVASTIELLDYYPQHYVSPSVAADLSHLAYSRAKQLHACPVAPPTTIAAPPPLIDRAASNDSFCQSPTRLVGLGATSAISTNYERRGEDRVHVSCRTEDGVWLRSLRMSKGLPRHVQEWMVACLLLELLGEVAGIVASTPAHAAAAATAEATTVLVTGQLACQLCLSMVEGQQDAELRHKIKSDFENSISESFLPYCDKKMNAFDLLLSGKIPRLLFNKHGVMHFDCGGAFPTTTPPSSFTQHQQHLVVERPCTPPLPSLVEGRLQLPFGEETFSAENAIYLLYPGTFAPLHYGHTELARVAAQVVRRIRGGGGNNNSSSSSSSAAKPVCLTFEVAMSRVGKETLQTSADLARVALQFIENKQRVVFTSAKLFIDKARIFPNHGFVVGVDTAMRVVNPVYYSNDQAQMVAALQQIEALGCYFVVAGRKWEGSNGWTGMTEIDVPKDVAHLFVAIPEADFRVDISSTELRLRAAAASSSTPSSPIQPAA